MLSKKTGRIHKPLPAPHPMVFRKIDMKKLLDCPEGSQLSCPLAHETMGRSSQLAGSGSGLQAQPPWVQATELPTDRRLAEQKGSGSSCL